MSWYYADNGRQTGPVTDEEFQTLIHSGKIQPDTLVWQQGMANWLPWREVQAAQPGQPAPGAPVPSDQAGPQDSPTDPADPTQVRCLECHNLFDKSDCIQYGTTWVCAQCKPIFIQRLTEGARPAAAATASATEEEILARDYHIDLGDSLDRAWKLFTANTGPVIGAMLLIALVFLVGSGITAVMNAMLTMSGTLAQCLYTGPILGGAIFYFLRLLRGEAAQVGDVFQGFSRHYLQLVLFALVEIVLNLLCLVPVLIVTALTGVAVYGQNQSGSSVGLEAWMIVGLVVGMVVAVAAIVYLSIIWTFTLALIVDKNYRFWPAMKLSFRKVKQRWWMTFLFLVVAGIISGLGVILCFVGLLVTAPIYFGMKACLYNDNFQDLIPQPD